MKYNMVNNVPGARTSHHREYNLWYNMFHRCYNKEYHITHPTYIGCTVCTEWRYLSIFLKDIKTLPGYALWLKYDSYQLDKDLISAGNKVYDKNNCCFVLYTVNNADARTRQNYSLSSIKSNCPRGTKCFIVDPNGNKSPIYGSVTEASICTGIGRNSIERSIKLGKPMGKRTGFDGYQAFEETP